MPISQRVKRWPVARCEPATGENAPGGARGVERQIEVQIQAWRLRSSSCRGLVLTSRADSRGKRYVTRRVIITVDRSAGRDLSWRCFLRDPAGNCSEYGVPGSRVRARETTPDIVGAPSNRRCYCMLAGFAHGYSSESTPRQNRVCFVFNNILGSFSKMILNAGHGVPLNRSESGRSQRAGI